MSNKENINKIVEQAKSVDAAISVTAKKIPFSSTSVNQDLKDNVFTELVKNGINLAQDVVGQIQGGIDSITGLIQGGLNSIPTDALLSRVNDIASNVKRFATDTLSPVTNVIDSAANFNIDSVTSAASEAFSEGTEVLTDAADTAATNLTSFLQGLSPVNAIKSISKFDFPLTDAQTNTAIKGQVFGLTSGLEDFAEGVVNENVNQLTTLSDSLIESAAEQGITDLDGIRTSVEDTASDIVSEQNVFTALNDSINSKIELNRAGTVFNGDATGINIADTVFDNLLSIADTSIVDKFTSIIDNIRNAIQKTLSYDLEETVSATQTLNTTEQTVSVINIQAVSQTLYNVDFEDIQEAALLDPSLNVDSLNIAFNLPLGELSTQAFINAGNASYT